MSELYRKGRPVSGSKGTVLFWVPGGMPLMLHVEGAVAAALKLRGVPVHAVICDGPFRACVKREIKDGVPVAQWQDACGQCKAHTSAQLDNLGIPYSFIGDFVTKSSLDNLWERSASVELETLDSLNHANVNIGKNARSAIIRYLQGESLTGHEEIVREYAFTALVCAEAAQKAIEKISPSRVFMSHGTYADWGPALKVALSRKLPVIAWMASYLIARFYFRSVEDEARIDFHNLSQTAWEIRKGTPLTSSQEARLDKFLHSRYKEHVSFDMKRLQQYNGAIVHLREKYAPSPDKPVWGINAHINWDAVSDYSPMAYESFDDWMLDTIHQIVEIPEVQWLVKVHPAEAWDNPASGVQRLIEKHFPNLPPHVRVIPAEEEISPLDFFELVDGGVTVYGTSGLELALHGKPIILAGEAHYGGKGFTYDGLSIATYRQLLHQAASMKPLNEEQKRLARQYAYSFFIQRQVPFPVVRDPNSSWWGFQFDKRELLLPGKDPFVDLICDRILDGEDFVMDERLVGLSNGTM
jgi:Capsule polysaccharide biosynthesis protein